MKSQPMNLPDDTASRAISKSLPGPDFLRYLPSSDSWRGNRRARWTISC